MSVGAINAEIGGIFASLPQLPQSGPSNGILTEDGDYLITEDGYYIVQEDPPA